MPRSCSSPAKGFIAARTGIQRRTNATELDFLLMPPPNEKMILAIGGLLTKTTKFFKSISMHAIALVPKRQPQNARTKPSTASIYGHEHGAILQKLQIEKVDRVRFSLNGCF